MRRGLPLLPATPPQVLPGSAAGSGWAVAVGVVQTCVRPAPCYRPGDVGSSRWDGSLRSPVSRTGQPSSSSRWPTAAACRMDESRTSSSVASTSSTGTPRSSRFGPSLDVVEVGVDHRQGLAWPDLDEGVEAVGPGRLEDRVLRQDLQADVVVGVAGRLRDLGEPVVGLQDAHHVGVQVGHHGIGGLAAAVLHVEDQQRQRDGFGCRSRGGRRLRSCLARPSEPEQAGAASRRDSRRRPPGPPRLAACRSHSH